MAQVGSTCYSSDSAAVSAIAAGETGRVVSAGSVVYVVDAVPASDSSITYTLNPIGGGTAIVTVQPVTVQPCQQLDWEDGLAIAWGIAGAWIAAAVVMNLKQAAHT